jgi:hypothetical protein
VKPSTTMKLIGLAWLMSGLIQNVYHVNWLPFIGMGLVILGLIFEEAAKTRP